ncbi:hypothetical protein [Variovorax paradoxus]|nr:hypothetical protein [Variovorax paradoxus]MDP9932816.1 hypothetical protein [Variovorax paradoxus]
MIAKRVTTAPNQLDLGLNLSTFARRWKSSIASAGTKPAPVAP